MAEYPPIPEKRYFTIGEVSDLCHVKAHVLRYWEQEFNQLNPCKRRGNRRYYQQDDVLLVRKIKQLLYEQGFTISGARSQLNQSPSVKTNVINIGNRQQMAADIIAELEQLRDFLATDR